MTDKFNQELFEGDLVAYNAPYENNLLRKAMILGPTGSLIKLLPLDYGWFKEVLKKKKLSDPKDLLEYAQDNPMDIPTVNKKYTGIVKLFNQDQL